MLDKLIQTVRSVKIINMTIHKYKLGQYGLRFAMKIN